MSLALPSIFAGAVSGLLLLAAWTDVTTLRISNWISVAVVALFATFALLADLAFDDLLLHLAAGSIVFAAGAVLFAWGKLGGGDVKLLSSVSLWIGWGHLLSFVLAVSVFGAFVTLAVIAVRRSLLTAIIVGRGYHPAILIPHEGAPYAVAVAAGFFFLLFTGS